MSVSPLFLLAPPRSFTSVINAMIGQHPQLFGLPELHLFNVTRIRQLWGRVSDDIGDASQRRHGLLRTIAEIYGGEQTVDTITMAEHWAAARENVDSGDIFMEIVDRLYPLSPVEKSPTYTISITYLRRIYKTFPYARFIHLTRHPIPQCRSVMNLQSGVFALFVNSIDFSNGKAIIDPQIAWHDLNINILNFLSEIPDEQHIRIMGEKVMESPENNFKEICRWLGIRDDDSAIDSMMHPERSPFACFGPVNALFGNDPNFLKRSTFRKHVPSVPDLDSPLPWRNDGQGLFDEVKALAREFGYR